MTLDVVTRANLGHTGHSLTAGPMTIVIRAVVASAFADVGELHCIARPRRECRPSSIDRQGCFVLLCSRPTIQPAI